MKFSIHQATSVGGRPVNEDRVGYAYSREALLMVLSDGMGGHAAGEVAAQIALQSLIQAFRLSAKPRVEDPLSFLSQAIINAHYAILEYARVNHIEGNPRATVVTCLVQEGGYAWWAHVGDSRLYHIRRGKVLTRTIDHSHAQLLIDQGHTRADVWQMTFAQVRLFTAAAERQHRRRLRDLATVMRAAQYDKGNFEKFLKALDG